MNTLLGSYKIYNFTPSVSPFYLIKLKQQKAVHFDINRHSIFTARSNARIAIAVLAMTFPSVCPSVRPSVTRRYCSKS